ncbi:MAG: hypothetical protein GY735_10435 [Delftia sp.]|nr:hypothetical protein [Delftia sp.]
MIHKTYIKPQNVIEIDKHLKDVFNSKIIETKLFALIKLIDLKGVKIEAPENECLHGLKVLQYKKGFYIGYIKTVYKNGSFKLQTYSLKNT